MRTYIATRLGYSLISLFLLSVTIFLVIRTTGAPAMMLGGPGGRPEDMQRVRVEWGLDRSWPEQYLSFIGNVLHGDLGVSFQYRMSVRDLYFDRLPNSLQLAAAGFLVSLLIGIPLVIMVNVGVIIETIFAWPGIGRLLYEGISLRDFPLVQGVVVMAGTMIVSVNLIVDLLYALIDPRQRNL